MGVSIETSAIKLEEGKQKRWITRAGRTIDVAAFFVACVKKKHKRKRNIPSVRVVDNAYTFTLSYLLTWSEDQGLKIRPQKKAEEKMSKKSTSGMVGS